MTRRTFGRTASHPALFCSSISHVSSSWAWSAAARYSFHPRGAVNGVLVSFQSEGWERDNSPPDPVLGCFVKFRGGQTKVVNFVTTYRSWFTSKLNRIIENTVLVCLWMQKCNSYIHSVSVLSQCDRFGSTNTNPSLPRHPRVDGNHSESVQQPSKVSLSVMEMTDFISLFLMHSMKEVLSHLQVWYHVDASVLQFLRFGWHRFNSTSTSTLSPSIITPNLMRLIYNLILKLKIFNWNYN